MNVFSYVSSLFFPTEIMMEGASNNFSFSEKRGVRKNVSGLEHARNQSSFS